MHFRCTFGHAAACKSKLTELRAEAAQHGVPDLDEALIKLESAPDVKMEHLANDKHMSLVLSFPGWLFMRDA